MSIPTYNLYNFVAQALENKFLIKNFYPWGEKEFQNIIDHSTDPIQGDTYQDITDRSNPNIKDLRYRKIPVLICHDQEPLDFDLYNDINMLEQLDNIPQRKDIEYFLNKGHKDLNLRWIHAEHEAEHWTLLHSEINSAEVDKYNATGLFRCAYWWAHAPIAIDWFRFAHYDNRLQRQSQDINANFLVYARGTTGKRAYRNSFIEQLKSIDSVQLGSINKQTVSSQTSAEYNPMDFAYTNCSIVLETVFDRIHLTEKTLRPLACGHPFLILNGPGALETIRSYGFRTFEPYINESYDKEQDSNKRMHMVLKEMQRINSLSTVEQTNLWKECNLIADYNKQLFFNDRFLANVKAELQRNVLV